MKKLNYIYLLAVLAGLQNCKEKEKIKLYDVDINIYGIPKNAGNKKAEVKVYTSAQDFWADKNVFKQGFAEHDGSDRHKFKIIQKSPQPDNNKYWMKVKFESLNNYRSGKKNIGFATAEFKSEYTDGNKNITIRYFQINLGTTPTKLQLRVFSNGIPVQGAKVYLYDTEANYNSKKNSDFFSFYFPSYEL